MNTIDAAMVIIVPTLAILLLIFGNLIFFKNLNRFFHGYDSPQLKQLSSGLNGSTNKDHHHSMDRLLCNFYMINN